MKRGLGFMTCWLVASNVGGRPALAQAAGDTAMPGRPGVAVHALLGAFLPVGARRRDLEATAYIGGQVVARLQPRLALVGGLALSQTTDNRISIAGSDVTLWQYDAGVEFAAWPPTAGPDAGWRLAGFLGGGAGGRTYDYRERGWASHTAIAGYISGGGELRPLRRGRAGIRTDVRVYFSHPEGAGGGAPRTDLVLMAGLVYHFR